MTDRTVDQLAATVRDGIDAMDTPWRETATAALADLAARATQAEEESNKLRAVIGAAQADKEEAEAEAARLREQLDEERGGIARTAKDAGQIITRVRQRAEAAEARIKELDELRDAATEEREEWIARTAAASERWEAAEARCAQLEEKATEEGLKARGALEERDAWKARCAQLEQALRGIENSIASYCSFSMRSEYSEPIAFLRDLGTVAREALAGPGTPWLT